jgi:hypothetical protein
LTFRARYVPLALSLLIAIAATAAMPQIPVQAASPKVAIIVGPVGGLTSTYRSMADKVAAAATAAGATVVKAYSPAATWANVRHAVNGATVVVYFGHGNGYPNPYSDAENTDRVNGWGLNRTTMNGDADDWQKTMVYCGEKALLGTLASTDGIHQWNYCGGKSNTDGISPTPGFTMVYAQAHYAPGFGERYQETDPQPTLTEAQQRVRHYSYPVLKLGGGGYIATAYADADQIVTRVLTQPTRTYADIFRDGKGYSASDLKTMTHPDISGGQVWVQRTVTSGHFGDPDYWYALAGNPNRTPSGTVKPAGPTIVKYRPSINSTNALTTAIVSATFDQPVVGVSGATFALRTGGGALVSAVVKYNTYWKRAELRPSAALEPGSTYQATITSGITSTAGVPTANVSWRFTTASSSDVETFSPPTRLTFRQGTHTGYRFDAAGQVTAIRTLTLARDSGASTSQRASLPNQSGRWFAVVDGAWAGYWIRESSALTLESATTAVDDTVLELYNPPVRISFRKGTHTGYQFSAAGAVMGERTYTLAWDSGASTSARRTLNNQYGTWFSVTNGVWGGYWVRESDVISLP